MGENKLAAQKSVFKMALPFVGGITVLLLMLIAAVGVIAVADQKQRQQQEELQYQQRAVDVVNNFLDQQDAFAKQLASQPSEIIVGLFLPYDADIFSFVGRQPLAGDKYAGMQVL